MQTNYWVYNFKGIDTGLKEGPELALLEVFGIFFSGINLLIEGDWWILEQSIYFKPTGTKVIEFLGADSYHIKDTLMIDFGVQFG